MRYILAILLTASVGCHRLRVERSLYAAGEFRPGSSYALVFAYENGSVETRNGSAGQETRVLQAGQQRRFLALRDDIAFRLRDHGVKVVDESAADYLVEITPTIRETDCARTCNAIQALSMVVVKKNDRNVPLTRVRLVNSSRNYAKTDDDDFSTKAAAELIAVLGGRE